MPLTSSSIPWDRAVIAFAATIAIAEAARGILLLVRQRNALDKGLRHLGFQRAEGSRGLAQAQWLGRVRDVRLAVMGRWDGKLRVVARHVRLPAAAECRTLLPSREERPAWVEELVGLGAIGIATGPHGIEVVFPRSRDARHRDGVEWELHIQAVGRAIEAGAALEGSARQAAGPTPSQIRG